MTQFRFNIMFKNNSYEDLTAFGSFFLLCKRKKLPNTVHSVIFIYKEPVYKNRIICNFHQLSYLLFYHPDLKNLHYQV